MEAAAGAARSCHRAPSNYPTTQAMELNLKCEGFRKEGGGAEEREWEGPTHVTTPEVLMLDVPSKAHLGEKDRQWASTLSFFESINSPQVPKISQNPQPSKAWRHHPGTEELTGRQNQASSRR